MLNDITILIDNIIGSKVRVVIINIIIVKKLYIVFRWYASSLKFFNSLFLSSEKSILDLDAILG